VSRIRQEGQLSAENSAHLGSLSTSSRRNPLVCRNPAGAFLGQDTEGPPRLAWPAHGGIRAFRATPNRGSCRVIAAGHHADQRPVSLGVIRRSLSDPCLCSQAGQGAL